MCRRADGLGRLSFGHGVYVVAFVFAIVGIDGIARHEIVESRLILRFADALFDGVGDLRILFEEFFGVFAAVSDALAFERIPRSRSFDDVEQLAEIEESAFAANALAIDDVDFDFAERRSDFVFDDFDLRFLSDDVGADFDER